MRDVFYKHFAYLKTGFIRISLRNATSTVFANLAFRLAESWEKWSATTRFWSCVDQVQQKRFDGLVAWCEEILWGEFDRNDSVKDGDSVWRDGTVKKRILIREPQPEANQTVRLEMATSGGPQSMRISFTDERVWRAAGWS